MKILMVAPTPFFSDRGCHVRIYEEAKALRALGHEVHICTYHLGRDMDAIPTYRIPAVPWYKKKSAGPSWHKPYLDILLFFTCLKTARRVRPDVIHAHLHEGAFIGFFLKRILGVPMVFDCQGSLTEELVDHGFAKRGNWLFKLFLFVEKLVNRWGNHVVTSSTPTAQLLRESFSMTGSDLSVVGDGVDTDVFRPDVEVATVREEVGLPKGKIIAVFLGAMTEYQGVDILLESIKVLGERVKNVHFLLMGYPEEGYEQKAKAMGIEHLVTFTGRIEYHRAPEYLCLGDLAVSPKISSTEANGKLFNYMACGLPTVVFDAPVNREILGDVGVYASFGDALSLAERVEELVLDRSRLTDLGVRVRERAVSDYSWTGVAKKLERIYRLMVS